MFLRNNMRPAYASADAGVRASKNASENDAFMYDAGTSETDDFGSFTSGAPSGAPTGAANNPRRAPKKQGGLNMKAIGVAVAALVAVVLLIVLMVALIAGSGKDLKYSDNTFISYQDSDGIWRVAANGKILKDYEGEIELRVADDRSFAYIIETVDEGNNVVVKNISYTDGKDITTVATSVADVLDTATLEPGVVWLDNDNGVFRYNEKDREEKLVRQQDLELTKDISGNYTFCISADGSTVAFNKYNDKDGKYRLCVYRDRKESSNYQRNLFAAELSDDGSFIYTYFPNKDGTKSLFVVPYNTKDDNTLPARLTDNFLGIIAMNTKGDELVVATISDATTSTSVVTFDPKKLEEPAVVTKICKGAIATPRSADYEIARFDTFADKYFETQLSLDSVDSPVFYLNKKFETEKIAQCAGKFSPDGNYFYYIGKNDKLTQVTLKNKDSISIGEDVSTFEITQKGNIYFIKDETTLMYYTVAKDHTERVADNVTDIAMHTYANTLYFMTEDNLSLFCSKESYKSEVAKIDNASGMPYFINPECKKTFVVFYDAEAEECKLFYTSNGKKFKLVGTCTPLAGLMPDIDTNIPDADAGETN